MDCAHKGAVGQGSTTGSRHDGRAQDTAAAGLKAEAAAQAQGIGHTGAQSCRDRWCGANAGHWRNARGSEECGWCDMKMVSRPPAPFFIKPFGS